MMSMLAAIDFNPILAPVLEVLNAILWPAIGLVGSIGTIYCIVLGVKLAKADEAGSREKAKKDLDNWFCGDFRSNCWTKNCYANIAGLGRHTNYNLIKRRIKYA